MCGIAGYINKSNKYRPSRELIKKMTDQMVHRGPDAEGQWTDEHVFEQEQSPYWWDVHSGWPPGPLCWYQ